MTDNEKSTKALEVALADYELKLTQKREIESYYETKRDELHLKGTERVARYLEDPGPFFNRQILYAHNDFETILKAIGDGTEWTIVSGLNPSGPLHFGHKAMMDVLLWFQKTYKVHVYIPITNDETYVVGKAASLCESRRIAYEFVIPSIIALGFDPRLTHIFVHSDYPTLTNLAMFLSKYMTYNTVRGLFGWTGSENIGTVFYMGALQMASIIMPQLPEFGGPKPVLVPVGIDQHPYIALSRDVAKRLRLVQPSEVIWKFLMGLKGPDKKMSSSVADSAIWLTDTPADAARKIKKAYTGGSSLASLHRERGAIPEVCSIFSLIAFNFLSDDGLGVLRDDYESGRLLSGDLKSRAIELVSDFLADHHRAREEAKTRIDDFILKTPIRTPLELDAIPAAAYAEETA
ncbi:MAG: tryptophan--tRNA ligase [Acidobacteriota bacterium]|nr:tryptophan--tRNA ligase [Acidobacteriota bacterium]